MKDLASNFLLEIRKQIDSSYKSYQLLLKDENFKREITKMDNAIKIKTEI